MTGKDKMHRRAQKYPVNKLLSLVSLRQTGLGPRPRRPIPPARGADTRQGPHSCVASRCRVLSSTRAGHTTFGAFARAAFCLTRFARPGPRCARQIEANTLPQLWRTRANHHRREYPNDLQTTVTVPGLSTAQGPRSSGVLDLHELDVCELHSNYGSS